MTTSLTGKSLIFEITPLVVEKLSGTHAKVLIIVPLDSIMQEQKNRSGF